MQILTYRLSVFGDFKRFVPTSENTIIWTQGFKNAGYELIPSIIQNTQAVMSIPFFNIPQGAIDKRMQFSSLDGNIIVRFLAERVDVEFTMGNSNKYSQYFVENIQKACNLLSVALNILGNIKGTRVAYFTDILIEENQNNCFESFYSNNADIFINNYDGEYIEWQHRFNKRIFLDIAHTQERVNTILQMESGELQTIVQSTGVQQIIKGLHVMADINTIAENTTERFDIDSSLEFCNKAQELYLDLLNQIMIKNI